jgi:hypothetical protein
MHVIKQRAAWQLVACIWQPMLLRMQQVLNICLHLLYALCSIQWISSGAVVHM